MPTLYAWVKNATAMTESISWKLNITYTDPYGDTNNLPNPILGQTGPAGQWYVNWSGADLGGTVTISATLNGCTSRTFSLTFYLVANDGANPTESQVDAITGCTANCSPWFLGSMIRWESGGKQFASNGYPTLNNNTNGTRDVGIAQVNTGNATYFTDPNDSPFWNFVTDIQDAHQVLLNKEGMGTTCAIGQSGCGAYAFWDSQVSQMCTYEQTIEPGAAYASGSATGDGSCSYAVNVSTVYTYCNFDEAGGEPSNYKDAELIQQYDGAPDGNFIYWNNSNEIWSFNAETGYVQNVCTSAPY